MLRRLLSFRLCRGDDWDDRSDRADSERSAKTRRRNATGQRMRRAATAATGAPGLAFKTRRLVRLARARRAVPQPRVYGRLADHQRTTSLSSSAADSSEDSATEFDGEACAMSGEVRPQDGDLDIAQWQQAADCVCSICVRVRTARSRSRSLIRSGSRPASRGVYGLDSDSVRGHAGRPERRGRPDRRAHAQHLRDGSVSRRLARGDPA